MAAMFSRRHPILFFILILSSIAAATVLGVALLFLLGPADSDLVSHDKDGEKVGVIEITGVVSEAKTINANLKRFREDDAIKAIVVRIDSPGGSVGPSQEIFREIRKTIKTKKVIASLGAIAASGGYYVAAGTNGIVANPGTITGSIGVIMGYTSFEKILEKIGLVPVVIKSGEYKDIGSPVREMTAKERKIIQDFVDKIHHQFVRAVAEGREMDPKKIGALADGRIYTGEEAKALGLVDRLGNLNDSIEWAGRLAGIKGKIVPVYIRDKKFSLMKYVTESMRNEILDRVIHSTPTAGYLYDPSN